MSETAWYIEIEMFLTIKLYTHAELNCLNWTDFLYKTDLA